MNTRSFLRSSLLTGGILLAASVALPTTSAAARRSALSEPPAGPLQFVQDDYAKALELARAQKTPIFMDFWAPW